MSAQANPCDLCDGTHFQVLLRAHPLLDGPLVRCATCHLVQVNPIAGRYAVADFAGPEAHDAAYRHQAAKVAADLVHRPAVEAAERAARARLWAERLDRIERVAPAGRLLEIGGDGQFLRLAAARGWSITGVQPDLATCERGRTLDGVTLLPSTLHEACFATATFDVVAAFHVLEHVPSPTALCREARRVLRPGGILVLETPNVDTWWFRLLGARWRQLIPDHYWFFSRTTLAALLTRAGFQTAQIESVGKAVSLRLLANRLERLVRTPLPWLTDALATAGLGARVLWLRPGDIMLGIARAGAAGNDPSG